MTRLFMKRLCAAAASVVLLSTVSIGSAAANDRGPVARDCAYSLSATPGSGPATAESQRQQVTKTGAPARSFLVTSRRRKDKE
jgi:hypothetical protein